MDYTGYKAVKFSNEELAHFYEAKEAKIDLLENEYLFVKDETDQIVDKYVFQDKKLRRVNFTKIESIHIEITFYFGRNTF